jgi:hypothetical protein
VTTTNELDRSDIDLVRTTRRRRAASIGAAAAAALLIWVVAHPIAGIDLIVGSGSAAHAIGPVSVVLVSAVVGAAAAAVAALLARITSRPRRAWFVTSGVLLILSLAGPLGAATIGAGLVLAAMHLVVGATLIVGIGRTLRPGREEQP